MTDDQTPSLAAVVDEFGKALTAAAGGVLAHIKAALDEATAEAFVLVPNDVDDEQPDDLAPWERALIERQAAADLGTADDGERGDPDMKAAWLRERDRAEQADADLAHARSAGASYRRQRDEALRLHAQAEADETQQRRRAEDTARRLTEMRERAERAEQERDEARAEAAALRAAQPGNGRLYDHAQHLQRRAEKAEQLAAERLDLVEQLGNHLNEVRDAVGAPDWPTIPDAIRDRLTKADRAFGELRERYDAAEAARARWQKRGEEAEATLAGARAQVERWRQVQNRQCAAHEIGPILGKATGEPPSLRPLVDQHPQMLRDFLRREVHNDPQWWRSVLRRELRVGYLAQDLRRAGLGPL